MAWVATVRTAAEEPTGTQRSHWVSPVLLCD